MNKLRGYTPIIRYNIVYEVIVDCQDQDFYLIVIVLLLNERRPQFSGGYGLCLVDAT